MFTLFTLAHYMQGSYQVLILYTRLSACFKFYMWYFNNFKHPESILRMCKGESVQFILHILIDP